MVRHCTQLTLTFALAALIGASCSPAGEETEGSSAPEEKTEGLSSPGEETESFSAPGEETEGSSASFQQKSQAQAEPAPEHQAFRIARSLDRREVVRSTLPAVAGSASVSRAVRRLKADAGLKNPKVQYSEATGAVSRFAQDVNMKAPRSDMPADQAALRFLVRHGEMFGLQDADLAASRFSRNFVSNHNGVHHLTLQFQVNDIDVFESALRINIEPSGRVISASGSPIPNAAEHINATAPTISEDEAIQLASEASEVAALGFTNVKGLVYFPVRKDQLRLAWDIDLRSMNSPAAYRVLVDAVDGSLLLRRSLTNAQHGAVYTDTSPIPNFPAGTGTGAAARVDVPFDGSAFFAPGDLHMDWWAGNPVATTIGNNADVFVDRDGNGLPDPGSQPAPGPGDDFTFPIDLTQDPSTYAHVSVANAFYWTNYLHDYFYSLGFTEALGNFQTDNFGLGGVGDDPVHVRVESGADMTRHFNCNAYMSTSEDDGTPANLYLYTCDSSTPNREVALDNIVVAHEYSHGIHQRLVFTSGSQEPDEGWADYFATGIFIDERDPYDAQYGFADYLLNDPTGMGWRNAPYTTDTAVFSLSFGDLAYKASCAKTVCSSDPSIECFTPEAWACPSGDTCVYTECSADEHCAPPYTTIDQGSCRGSNRVAAEVFANALHIMRANLIAKRGFAAGRAAADQLVFDGIVASTTDPTLLDNRYFILEADQVNSGGADTCLIWESFAKMGMGFSAATTGKDDIHPTEAFDVPAGCVPTAEVSGPTDLGEACPGEAITETLTVENIGAGELIITSVERVSGSTHIEVDDATPLPQILSAGEDAAFTVTCTPSFASAESAVIRITSNDPADPTIDVTYTCERSSGDLEAPADVVGSICLHTETVTVGTASLGGSCAASITGEVIATNGDALIPPIEVVGGQVDLGPGTHVIRWTATVGDQTEEVLQNVTIGGAVQAENSYLVTQGAQVEDSLGNPAAVFNRGAGMTTIRGIHMEVPARVGTIIAGGAVEVNTGGHVIGDIYAVGSTTAVDMSGVTGSIVPIAATDLPGLPPLPTFPPPGTAGFWVNPTEDKTIEPGTYADVAVNGNPDPSQYAILRFQAGDYYIENLYLNAVGITVVAAPGTRIFVRQNINYHSPFRMAVGSDEPAPVYLGVAGSGDVGMYAPFEGTILAPQRKIFFGTADGLTFRGSFYAADIEVTPGSVLICDAGDGGAAPDYCDDDILNYDETDVDCGGLTCPNCMDGNNCSVDSDCVSNVCYADLCQVPTCSDGTQNGDETGEDCGGSCDPCPTACTDQTYDAVFMDHSTGNASWEGGWNIFTNGYISTEHDFAPGSAVIRVLAMGQEAAGLPHMNVTVDGTSTNPTAGVYVESGGFDIYEFAYNAPGGNQEVAVEFDNDYYGPLGDRNLIVDTVEILCP